MSSHADNNDTATPDMAITSVAAALANTSADSDIGMTPVANQPGANVTMRAAFQHRHHSFLVVFYTPESSTARNVMMLVMYRHSEVMSGMQLLRPVHDFFWKQFVGIGTLTLGRSFNIDVESQRTPMEVFIQNIEHAPELTAGYKNLDLLDDTHRFIDQYPGVVNGSLEHKVLVVGRKLKKKVVALITVAGLILSVVIGVVVGLVTQVPAHGITACTCMIGAIAVLVTLCIWMIK